MAAESAAFTPLTLPVLPLDDEVVLPGMVVPLDLSDAEVRAAVEAAQAAARSEPGKPRVLLVPRIDGNHAALAVAMPTARIGTVGLESVTAELLRVCRQVRQEAVAAVG